LASDDIQKAVEKFTEDLEQDRESAKPQAWYVEQGIPTLWDDEYLSEREDLLWGLLKLYSSKSTTLESVLQPENSQLSPLDVRLSWQLSQALISSGRFSYMNGDEKANQLTLSFASQLTSEGYWLDATFVLLHLTSASTRTMWIQSHLAHHANRIGSEDSSSFITLTQNLKIPASWVWEAKALYMRAVTKDTKQEVECLLRAGLYDEAHRTFSRNVAPRVVVERDYDTLRSLLSGFDGMEDDIQEWHLGGEVYYDFLDLLTFQKQGLHLDGQTVERLLAALPAMVEEERHAGFAERVAISEISECLANIVVEMGRSGNTTNLPKVLRLPLTEDKVLKHTVELSMDYYRSVLAGGR